jgi:hypothetical protein
MSIGLGKSVFLSWFKRSPSSASIKVKLNCFSKEEMKERKKEETEGRNNGGRDIHNLLVSLNRLVFLLFRVNQSSEVLLDGQKHDKS